MSKTHALGPLVEHSWSTSACLGQSDVFDRCRRRSGVQRLMFREIEGLAGVRQDVLPVTRSWRCLGAGEHNRGDGLDMLESKQVGLH